MGLVRGVPSDWSPEEVIDNISVPSGCDILQSTPTVHLTSNKTNLLHAGTQRSSYKKTVALKPRSPPKTSVGYDRASHEALIKEYQIPAPDNGCAIQPSNDQSPNNVILDLLSTLIEALHQNNILKPSNVAQLNNVLKNFGEPTRRTHINENISAVDLSMCSANLASKISWKPLVSTFGSDHFPILLNLPNKNNKHCNKRSPRCKYNLKNVDWDIYRNRIENEVKELSEVKEGKEAECSNVLAKIILKVADEIFPTKPTKTSILPFPPWWDKECSEAIKKRKSIEKAYNKDMSEENLEILNAIIKDTQILLKDKKREGWKSFCASLSPNSNPSEVWNSIRRFRSVYRDQQFIVPESLAEEFIDTIAPPSVPSQLAYFPILKSVQMDHNYATLSTPFTLYELKGILSGVDDSAPGLDGIPYSFLTHLGDSALEYYLNIINVVLLTGNIPPQWKEQEVIPVLKPNKNPEEASSYRPIVLSSVLAKIAEHLVKNRIECL
ncbi:unnamed protein product [Colias eurytheme]|nr:unnamed protein product [Colias eurytheme]